MKPIPLNLLTLYADLLQSREHEDMRAASIAIKTVKKRKYVYATSKDGGTRVERYLGQLDDPDVREEARRLQQAAERARQRRSTVSALKRSRFPAPPLTVGRMLEVIANKGLFDRGLTLVGTAAYQTYPGILGHYMPTATYATNDVDLSVAELVCGQEEEDLETLLRRADPTFTAVWAAGDKLPKTFRASNGLLVELLTKHGRGRTSPVPVAGLKASAVALSFQEYVSEDTIQAVALYNEGVSVRVPSPVRFAVHKLIVAHRRGPTATGKRLKDLRQAQELIDIFLATDEAMLQDALDSARARGVAWRSAINASLRVLGRDAREGSAPLPVQKPKTKRPSERKRTRL